MAEYFRRTSGKEGFDPSSFQGQQIESIRSDPGQARLAVETTSRQLDQAIRQRYRIYCLSPFPHVNLMWSHYSDSHRGICLEFSTRNEVLAVAQKVKYCKTFTKQEVHDGENEVLQILLTKSDDWEYEQEYRIVAHVGEVRAYPEDRDLLVTHNDFLNLPRGALRAVIVGCQADFSRIRGIVDDCSIGLQVKTAKRMPNHYRLQID